MRRRFVDVLPFLSSSPRLGEGGDVLTGQTVVGSPRRLANPRSRYTPSGVFGQLAKAAGAPSRAVSPVTPGFAVLNSSSLSVRAGGCDWPPRPLSDSPAGQPRDEPRPSSRSAAFGTFRSLGVDFRRHFVIGSSGRSAFSGRSRRQPTSVIGCASGLGAVAEAGGRGPRPAIPRRLLRGWRGAGRWKAGWGRKEAEAE